MCFSHDYDWCADVHEERCVRAAAEAARCDECSAPIPAGDWCYTVFQQEHEMCSVCEDEASLDYEEEPEPHDCDYGETYNYVRCVSCSKMLESIYRLEEEEGCPWDSRQPSLGELHQEAFEDDKYAPRILKDWPELAGHRWLV